MTSRRVLFSAVALLTYAGLAALGASAGSWARHLAPFLALYALAWGAALGMSRAQPSLAWLLLGAAVFRALLAPLTPSLSSDLFRYVWEGRVQNAGFDPFLLPPAAPELAPLRDAVWSQINNPEATAIYPPAAQLAFRALALAGGLRLFKLAFVALDLALVALLGAELRRRGKPLGPLALYAWGPLAVVEVAGSGHFEPLGILPLVAAVVWARRRPALAWGALACSILSKYAGIVVLPFLVQAAPPRPRRLLLFAAVLALASAPYLGAGRHLFDSLRLYAEHWRYNDLLFSLLQSFVPAPRQARALAAALLLAACVLLLRWNLSFETRCITALAAAVALSPTIHPWYLLWPLALVPLRPSMSLYVWSGTAALSYLFLYPALGIGPLDKESWGLELLEMAPVAIAAAAAGIARSAKERVHACRSASS